jgi:transmembrane sensor
MTSTRIPVPVRELLDERLPESSVKRVWNGMEAKRSGSPLRAKWPRAWTLAVASAALGAVLMFFWMRPPAPTVLHLTDGSDVPPHLEARATPISFDDGSELTLRPGARLDLLESTARTFSVALRGGAVVFDVHPGGPRLWRVACGPVTVEVVGTHFTVVRDTTQVEVSVERGAVLVSGPPVPDHAVRLGPQQSIVVPLTGPSSETPTGARAEEEGAGPGSPLVASGSAVASSPPYGEREAHPRSAPATPGAAPFAVTAPSSSDEVGSQPPPGVETLLARADEARLAGRYQEAAEILEHVVTDRASDRRTALAEFSLGRLYLDSLGDPSRAAIHFSRALLRGLSDALAEDAYARLVEAYARAGDSSAARDVADRYRARYPQGRRLASINRWTAPAP